MSSSNKYEAQVQI